MKKKKTKGRQDDEQASQLYVSGFISDLLIPAPLRRPADDIH